MQKCRPVAVSIIVILTVIGGIAFISGGIMMIVVAPLLSNANMNTSNIQPTIVSQEFITTSRAVGAAIIALCISYFVMSYGLLKGKPWAWNTTITLSVIGIALGTSSIITGNVGAILSIIINVIVLYYLYRPYVKVYFGKVAPSSASISSLAS